MSTEVFKIVICHLSFKQRLLINLLEEEKCVLITIISVVI